MATLTNLIDEILGDFLAYTCCLKVQNPHSQKEKTVWLQSVVEIGISSASRVLKLQGHTPQIKAREYFSRHTHRKLTMTMKKTPK